MTASGKPQETSLSFSEINPFIRYSHSFSIKKDTPFVDVKAYDYRLMYIMNGSGSITVDGKNYPVQEGSLLFWLPGAKYCFRPKENITFHINGINFDFTQNNKDKFNPVAPEHTSVFKTSEIIERVVFKNFKSLNGTIHLENMHAVEGLMTIINQEYETKKIYNQGVMNGILIAIINQIARAISVPNKMAQDKTRQIGDILKYIQDNYNQPIDNKTVAKHFNFHPGYLGRIMVKHTGYPLNQYIIRYRISMAVNLLQTTYLSVAEIASLVGFTDANYFSRCFKNTLGMRPKDFRIANHSKQPLKEKPVD